MTKAQKIIYINAKYSKCRRPYNTNTTYYIKFRSLHVHIMPHSYHFGDHNTLALWTYLLYENKMRIEIAIGEWLNGMDNIIIVIEKKVNGCMTVIIIIIRLNIYSSWMYICICHVYDMKGRGKKGNWITLNGLEDNSNKIGFSHRNKTKLFSSQLNLLLAHPTATTRLSGGSK